MLSILRQFLSNPSQYVVVNSCQSKLVNVVSGVPRGSVLVVPFGSCCAVVVVPLR